jgi:anti-anti-sigma regulatory factor
MVDQLIRVDGPFDAAAAHVLRARLAASTGRETVVDFSQVATYDPVALAMLADALAVNAPRSHVVLRGLCHRQERLLRYFGVAPADAPARDG